MLHTLLSFFENQPFFGPPRIQLSSISSALLPDGNSTMRAAHSRAWTVMVHVVSVMACKLIKATSASRDHNTIQTSCRQLAVNRTCKCVATTPTLAPPATCRRFLTPSLTVTWCWRHWFVHACFIACCSSASAKVFVSSSSSSPSSSSSVVSFARTIQKERSRNAVVQGERNYKTLKTKSKGKLKKSETK